jgi:hypothetical protein
MTPVELDAFLSDSVQATGGKLHALGIGWRVIQAGGFPVRHDRVGVGLMVHSGPADAGQHTLTLTLEGPDGRVQPFGDRRHLELPFTAPASGGTATLALNLDGLVFQGAGQHAFVVAVDGRELSRLPFQVQTTPAPPATDYRTGVYL